MAAERIRVEITGESGDLRAALTQASRELRGFTGTASRESRQSSSVLARANDHIKRSFGSMVGRMVAAGAGIAGAYASVAAAKNAITTTEDLAKSTLALHRNLGFTIEDASRWSAVAKARGVDTDQLSQSFTILSKNTEAALGGNENLAKAFGDLGISQADAKKGQQDFNFLLGQVADGLGNMEGGQQRAALAYKVLGRSAQTTLPIFTAGKRAMEDQLKLADKYGVTFAGKPVRSIRDLIRAQRELEFAQMGLQIQFTQALGPALVDLARKAQDLIRVFNRDDLTPDEKFERFKRILEPLGDQMIELVEDAMPRVANAAADAAPDVALAFVKGFLSAGPWGQLLIGGWLLKKLGGLGALRGAGRLAGLEVAGGMAGGVAATTVATGAGGAAGAAGGAAAGAGRGAATGAAEGAAAGGAAGILARSKPLLGRAALIAKRSVYIGLGIEAGNALLEGVKAEMDKGSGDLGKHLKGLEKGFHFDSGTTAAASERLREILNDIQAKHRGISASTKEEAENLARQLDITGSMRQHLEGILEVGAERNPLAGKGREAVMDFTKELARGKQEVGSVVTGLLSQLDELPVGAQRKAARFALNWAEGLRQTGDLSRREFRLIKSIIETNLGQIGGVSMAGPRALLRKMGFTFDELVEAVRNPTSEIGEIVANALEALGEGQSAKNIRARVTAEHLQRSGRGQAAKQLRLTRARGGFLPGSGRLDTVPVMAAPDEFFATRHQQDYIEPAMAFAAANGVQPYGSLDDLARGVQKPHYMAKGGRVAAAGGSARTRANRLDKMELPYVWGGHHGDKGPIKNPAPGLDCSSAVSYVLGIPPRVSGQFMNYGKPGKGPITIFANPGHVFMSIAGRGFGTSAENPGGGPGWLSYSSRPGFAVRSVEGAGAEQADVGEIGPLRITGPDGAPKALVTGALRQVRSAANEMLATAGAEAGGSGGGDAGFGSDAKGSWRKVMRSISQERDWSEDDWLWVVQHESSGKVSAKNPSSTAFGLGQLLDMTYRKYGGGPGTGGSEQIRAMARYIADRYGDPTAAKAFWEQHGYYERGGFVQPEAAQGMLAALPHFAGGGPVVSPNFAIATADKKSYKGWEIDDKKKKGKEPTWSGGKQYTPEEMRRFKDQHQGKTPAQVQSEQQTAADDQKRRAEERAERAKERGKRKHERDMKADRRRNRQRSRRVARHLGGRFKTGLPDLSVIDHLLDTAVPNVQDLLDVKESAHTRAPLMDVLLGREDILPENILPFRRGHEFLDIGTDQVGDLTVAGQELGRRDTALMFQRGIRDMIEQAVKRIKAGLAEIQKGIAERQGRIRHLKEATKLTKAILAERRKEKPNQNRVNRLQRDLEDEGRELGLKPKELRGDQGFQKLLVGRFEGEREREQEAIAPSGPWQSDKENLAGRMKGLVGGGYGGDLKVIRDQILDTEAERAQFTREGLTAQLQGFPVPKAGTSDRDSQLADLIKEQNRIAARTAAINERLQPIFAGFKAELPYLGGFQHGIGRVPRTGVALLHRDEMVTPDPQGPFGSQLGGQTVGRDSPVEVTLVMRDRAGQLVELIDARVGEHTPAIVRRVDQGLGRDARIISTAPGR